MEPTMAEIIWGAVIAIAGFVVLIKGVLTPDDTIEVSDRKLAEWEREERRWR